MQILLSGAKVFKNGTFISTDVLIRDGFIVSLDGCHEQSGTVVYNFNNKYIFPGFTDVHVHLREPGFLYKEDIETGSRAAARGGYTDICAMPNLSPVPDSAETLSVQSKAIREKACINVYPYGSITKEEKGAELAGLEEMAGNVIGFSDDGRGVQTEEMMLEAMERVKKLGSIIAAHCEDNALLGGAHVHAGKIAGRLGINGITSESEWKMIERDIRLVKKTGCPYHVCHVSTKESVELIRKAKAEGVNITCETAPHYLLLSEEDILAFLEEHEESEAGRYKMNPPLRSETDRKALTEGLIDGTIDMIATDHAPHSAEEKTGLTSGLMGIVGLETAFPVLYTGLVKKGIISLERLVELMSTAPAKRFNIECGIEVGRPAKLAVWDLESEYMIDADSFSSKGRFTPFDGMRVNGKCIALVLNEKIMSF